MTDWSLVYTDYEPEKEKLREALCTLGNGYFATRGAAAESDAGHVHYPGTYLAGGYNRLESRIAGRVIENEDLVNLPNWLSLAFRVEDGEWFDLESVEILSYRQELDLKRGLLHRTVRFRDQEGRETTLRERRLVHMRFWHVAALETRIVPENWTGRITVRSAIDGRVINAGVERYKELSSRHLEPLESGPIGADGIFLKVQTVQSEIRVAQAARTRLFVNGSEVAAEPLTTQELGYISQHFATEVAQGSELRIEKTVTFCTSRDNAVSECGNEARLALRRLGPMRALVESHVEAWDHLWRRFDIGVEHVQAGAPEERMAMILRLHIFHLLQTISMHTMDMDVGVPSRGWHGEAYRGHVFWDELFIFPLFNLRLPQVTRALLKYRCRRLREARAAAREAGYRGAMFPWQSGSDGREETQTVHLNPRSGRWTPDNSHRQRHVNAAIAYNAWRYFEATRDTEFMCFDGAELILEIARFWSSIATYNPGLGRYEISGVVGPDEYHDDCPGREGEGLKNNAYTNVMAVWVLCRALSILEHMPEDRRRDLWEMLDLSAEETERWKDITRKMRVVFHEDGIISQFEGYEDLQEFDWEGYRRKYGDIQRLDRILEAENDTPNRYKVSKQADVLMLFYLFSAEELLDLFEKLGYPFACNTIPRNIDYYLKRTSHGSTLSRVVHSWVLARSNRPGSEELFQEALESDVEDIQGGTTAEGIHLGAMAGSVDLVQRCLTGIETRGDVLWFSPCLPEEIARLKMQIRYRQHSLRVELTQDELLVEALRSPEGPIRVGYKGEVYELQGGERRQIALVRRAA